MVLIASEKTPSCPPFHPTACCELLHGSTATYVTAVLQLFVVTLLGMTYYVLEQEGYFVNPDASRPVVACTGTLYAIGAIIAVIGVATERRGLVNAHVTITTSLMVFTDMIAIGIVFIMAIGNRNDFTNSLPSHFVNEKKFYDAMGPFWMYLGAFSLHITVAFNMCCLQPYNSFISFLDSKAKSKSTAIGKVEERAEKTAELEETKKKSKDQ
ncbi:hypothetical protein V3C99_003254 [Haemonchus contortus]|uniref:Conserved plasma membrane protein n=1 Tax=Haemonchus contortus TaxID=6289 RepID=A0A7I4XYX8_HAECO|nr:Protein T10E9.8 [Haemonchus contortus]